MTAVGISLQPRGRESRIEKKAVSGACRKMPLPGQLGSQVQSCQEGGMTREMPYDSWGLQERASAPTQPAEQSSKGPFMHAAGTGVCSHLFFQAVKVEAGKGEAAYR
eukprot:1156580-Pelagomonas_calceolata.AAC.3